MCHPHRERGEEAGVSIDTEQKVSCSSSSSSSPSSLHRLSGPSRAPVRQRRLRTPVWARSLFLTATHSPTSIYLHGSKVLTLRSTKIMTWFISIELGNTLQFKASFPAVD